MSIAYFGWILRSVSIKISTPSWGKWNRDFLLNETLSGHWSNSMELLTTPVPFSSEELYLRKYFHICAVYKDTRRYRGLNNISSLYKHNFGALRVSFQCGFRFVFDECPFQSSFQFVSNLGYNLRNTFQLK